MADRIKVDKARALALRAHGLTLAAIAAEFGVTKAAISRALNAVTRRTNQNRSPAPCGCGCDVLIVPPRKYATLACYYRVVNHSGPAVLVRHKQRQARAIVAEVFDLQPDHVVHHVDKNNRNNALANLWVFVSNSDHLKHHRGGNAEPIWRGDDVVPRPAPPVTGTPDERR